MKVVLGFYQWVILVLVVIWTAFMFPTFSTLATSSSSRPDINPPLIGISMKGGRSIRKLELGNYAPSTKEEKRAPGYLNLEDYNPFDPSPSSRAKITSGPIEHGAPIIPYIPKVPPPSPPMQDGGPSPPV